MIWVSIILFVAILVYFGVLYIVAHGVSSNNTGISEVLQTGKNVKWWAVSVGLIGTTISGVTFISVPGVVSTNSMMTYFQFVLGNFVGFLFIAYVLLPLYYRINLNSIYVYIGNRFGRRSHRTAAYLFIVSRLIGSTFRLYLGCLVLQVIVFDTLGIPFVVTASLFIFFLWAYTRRGGIRTIIWTDFFQTLILIAVAIITFVALLLLFNLSLRDILSTLFSSRHATLFSFDSFFDNKHHFIKQFMAGIFMCIAMSGLDQDMMQKNLKLKTVKEAKKNYISFAFLFVFVNFFFLSLGLVFYEFMQNQGIDIPSKTDTVFAILSERYLGVVGMLLFVFGVLASTLSSCASSLLALSSSFVLDIKKTHASPGETPDFNKTIMKTHAWFTLAFLGVLLLFHFVNDESVVVAVFKMAGYTYGPLLALFVLGLFSRLRINDSWTLYIVTISIVLSILIDRFSEFLLFGYRFGFEILLVNAFISMLGFYISSWTSKPSNEVV